MRPEESELRNSLFGPNWPKDVDGLCEWMFDIASRHAEADPVQIRELADSVWHFLGEEFAGHSASLDETQDAIVKLTRELGQPRLAELVKASVRNMANETIWPGNIATAHRLGILTLSGFESPAKLLGGWLQYEPNVTFDMRAWQASLQNAAHRFSDFFVISENQFTRDRPSAEVARSRLRQAMEQSGLHAVVNLNWRILNGDGGASLFSEPMPSDNDPLELLDARYWHPDEMRHLTWRWHLSDDDLLNRQRLIRACESALVFTSWHFVLNRPKEFRPGAMGLLRNEAAIMQRVTIHLPAFVEYCKSRLEHGRLGQNILGSLARLVFESAHARQKIIKNANSSFPRNISMLVALEGSANFKNELIHSLRREAEYETTGLSVYITDPSDPVIDLRTNTGFGEFTADVHGMVNQVKLMIDSGHPLTMDRLIHVLCELYRTTKVREIAVHNNPA